MNAPGKERNLLARTARRWNRLLFKIKLGLGFDLRLASEDRRVMEDIILPYLGSRDDVQRILFVGCDWYTRSYGHYFPSREYWTIEIDPCRRKYGAKRHITDSLEHLDRYFTEHAFDVIVCNGVFGWGLNGRQETETAFAQCRRCLRPGGLLVIGWNDIPERRPFPLEECQSLATLQPHVFPPLSTAQYQTGTPNRHIFNFYCR